MSENQCSVARRGYVRAVFCERVRGHAAPLDLVRSVLAALQLEAVRLREAEMRELSHFFGGYLVTEPDEEIEPAFSKRRAWHLFGVDGSCCASPRLPADAEYSDVAGGSLDAPVHMAAGACFADGCLFSDVPQWAAKREPWPWFGESAGAFADRRAHWLSYCDGLSSGRSGPDGGAVWSGVLRDGFENGSIDAPEYMAAGAARWIEYLGSTGGFSSMRLCERGRQ